MVHINTLNFCKAKGPETWVSVAQVLAAKDLPVVFIVGDRVGFMGFIGLEGLDLYWHQIRRLQ